MPEGRLIPATETPAPVKSDPPFSDLKKDRGVYLTALKIAKVAGGAFLGPLFSGGIEILEALGDAADDAELEARLDDLRSRSEHSQDEIKALAALAETILVKQDEISETLRQQGLQSDRPIDEVGKTTALIAYRAEVAQRFYYADYRGIADTASEEHVASFSADRIYVTPRLHAEGDLRGEREQKHELHRRLDRLHEFDDDDRRRLEDELAVLHQRRWGERRDGGDKEDGATVGDALARARHAVIIGGPGVGKSALTRYLARSCALGADVTRERLGWDEDLAPIHLPLAAYAEARRDKQHLSIAAHLRETSCTNHGSAVEQALAEAVQRGNAIVLLDGVDEVPDERERLSVVRAVDAFLGQHGRARCIVTSRPAGYYRVAGDVSHFELRNFSAAQVREFVGNWQRAFEERRHREHPNLKRVEAEAAEMVKEIEAHPRVTALARNPLILVIIALIRHNQLRLPERRVELYKLAVHMLLETWNRLRSEPKVDVGGSRLPLERLLPVWGRVAEWMRREQPTGFVHREVLKRKLTEVLTEEDDEDPEQTAESYIHAVVHTAGILEERFPKRFAFWHPTFEEFLAAVSMATPSATAAGRLLPLRGDPRWREVIQLTVGYVGIVMHDRQTATKTLRALLEDDPDPLEPLTHPNLRLVVDCITDGVGARRELLAQLLKLFAAILPGQPFDVFVASFEKLVLSSPQFRPSNDTVRAIGSLASHPRLGVRVQTLRLLSNVAGSDSDALRICGERMVDDHAFVKAHAAVGLAKNGDLSSKVCNSLCRLSFAGGYDTLVELLRNERVLEAVLENCDDAGRLEVAKVLLKTCSDHERVVSILISGLEADEVEFRADAAELLINNGIGWKAVLDKLVLWLNDEDSFLRFLAADMLMKHGHLGDRLDQELATWMEADDLEFRLNAADVLVHRRGLNEKILGSLKYLLTAGDEVQKLEAARLLIENGIDDEEIFETLISLSRSHDGARGLNAAGMLLENGRDGEPIYQALESLCEANAGASAIVAAELLVEHGRGQKVMMSWLGSHDLRRSYAAGILIKQGQGEERVLEALTPWLGVGPSLSTMDALRRLSRGDPLGHEAAEALAALVSVREDDDARCRLARSHLFELIFRHAEGSSGLGQLT